MMPVSSKVVPADDVAPPEALLERVDMSGEAGAGGAWPQFTAERLRLPA